MHSKRLASLYKYVTLSVTQNTVPFGNIATYTHFEIFTSYLMKSIKLYPLTILLDIGLEHFGDYKKKNVEMVTNSII